MRNNHDPPGGSPTGANAKGTAKPKAKVKPNTPLSIAETWLDKCLAAATDCRKMSVQIRGMLYSAQVESDFKII